MSSDKKFVDDVKFKKGKGVIVKLVFGFVLVGVGGGGVFVLMQFGMIVGGVYKKEDNMFKLICKGEEDFYVFKVEGGKEGGGLFDIDGEGGSEYCIVYYSFVEEFMLNLKNLDGFIQVSFVVLICCDGWVLMWFKKYELVVCLVMFGVFVDMFEEDVYNIDGKQCL